ncbi:hypothetical protein [Methylocystis sp. SC2]|uniref:hypothetical protein n=1 Tax=Methylocystis sp. (strain SC2) TaxID=187303 RepID=UPI00027AEBBB|nr:hypothetical protein [Methylocystis sp. SC2]CCJ07500.1 Uncharacterized protein BN69_2049 [Methylocystis sp. SC2]
MLSGIARLMLTASSMAPIGFTYAWVAFTQNEKVVAVIAASFSVIAVISCVFTISYAKKFLERMNFKAAAVEAADKENIGFMLLYLLPLFTDKINTLNWQLWIPVIGIFSVITATGYSYHFNPLLGLMGWHFYKVESTDGVTFVLITKKHLRTAANKLVVGQLTEYILLDME